jgi:hypothetical protein
MKRITALVLVCLIIFSGCSAAPKPALSEMLGTFDNGTYTSPFGFVLETAELHVFSESDLAAVNYVDEFTPEALTAQTDSGNAVLVFAAAPADGSSLSISLFPAAGLPDDVRSAEEYAAYGLPLISGKLESAGYTGIQVQQISVKLDDSEHPALLCSAEITEGVPYHLLQICFREGDWMGSLSLSSVESEEALGALLARITTTD